MGTPKKGHKEKPMRFVSLEHWLMKTPAWRSLSGNERAIYIEILSRYMGTNNGVIPYSCREAVDSLRIGKTTASKAIRTLQERGFIVAMKQGAFSLKARHATEWRLTDRPFNYDAPSREFARWGQV